MSEKKELKKLVVFTGAGISAESGIPTFRDSKGLWENFSIEEVATPIGWLKDQNKVLEFYNQRRRQLRTCEPNLAHQLIADLENHFDVIVVTQNIDDLHERAGSNKVIHLHGELLKARSVKNPELVYECLDDINPGDTAEDGSQLRPAVVWFGESVAYDADIFVIIGTSLQVYPAADLFSKTQKHCEIYVIDPTMGEGVLPRAGVTYYKTVATEGTQLLFDELTKE